jgi:hypothetical protein
VVRRIWLRRALGAAFVAGLFGWYHLLFAGVVWRMPKSMPEAWRYLEDVRALEADTGSWVQGRSPDGKSVLTLVEAARSFNTIHVLDRAFRVHAIVSVRESDPGSGLSYRVGWTRDSKAVIVTGHGALPLGRTGRVCLVYELEPERLLRIQDCPTHGP